MDGAPVGHYTPVYSATKPRARLGHREKFRDPRDPALRTDAHVPETKYPVCTSQGAQYCSVALRAEKRGGKTLLSDSVILRINPVEVVNPATLISKTKSQRRLVTQTSSAPFGEEDSSIALDTQPDVREGEDRGKSRHVYVEKLRQVRRFEHQIARDQPKNLCNGIHPGVPMRPEVNENAFHNSNSLLMSQVCSKYRNRVTAIPWAS
jgi:hypothetical protein